MEVIKIIFMGLFSAIQAIFGFTLKTIKAFFTFFYQGVELVAGLFGINTLGGKLVVAFFGGVLLSIIPDLIVYNCLKLSKKYKSLESNEEKKEYLSEHMHFLLKDILTVKNKIDLKLSSIRTKKGNKKRNSAATSDEVVNIVSNSKTNPVVENTSSNVENNIENNEIISAIENISSNLENNETIKTNEKSNIKLLYSSNVIGNMLKNGTVLKRKFLNSNVPFLVEFGDKPKELFTGHSCDMNSGIEYNNMVCGKKIQMFLDNPEFLSNPKLYDSLTKEELEKIKEELLNNKKYQASLKAFFTINDKALEYKKS